MSLFGGMTIPHTNTDYEPNSETDMSGRFVPIVDLTQEDADGDSHLSSNNVSLVTFSQADGDLHAESAKSPSDTKSDWSKPLAITVSQCKFSWFT